MVIISLWIIFSFCQPENRLNCYVCTFCSSSSSACLFTIPACSVLFCFSPATLSLPKSPVDAPLPGDTRPCDQREGSADAHTCDPGSRETRKMASLSQSEEEQSFDVLLFKMQQCKGHRGGDETRSCNEEGEIKNNDRNKLS